MNANQQHDGARDDLGFWDYAPVSGEEWVTDPKTGIRSRIAGARVEESGAAVSEFVGWCAQK